jgi:segregation and condensation protein B
MAKKKKNKSLFASAGDENSQAASTVNALLASAAAELENIEFIETPVEALTETPVQASMKTATELASEEFKNIDETDEETAAESEESEESDELAQFEGTNIFTEEEATSFLPEATDDEVSEEALPDIASVEGTELDAFESAQIEEVEFVEEEQLDSIIESILFASDRPVSLASMKLVFKGTNIKGDKIKRALDRLAVELAGARRGVTLEEVPGGFQIRTKMDNLQFLTRTLKARQFRLSGPALEVLAIVAYKQPIVKSEIDEIRGVESGHLLRALMEKSLVVFEGKSDLPGKPMQYGTTKKFLEIFGLRNLKELPTLSQIDELLPEGMTEEEAKPTLSQVTDNLSQAIGGNYSEGEEELMKITDQLTSIDTSSDFFEQEKVRQRQKRDAEKAQNIREALAMDEAVPNRDRNWLTRYDEALLAGNMDQFTAGEHQQAVQEEKQMEAAVQAEETAEDELFADTHMDEDDSDRHGSGEASL